MTKVQKTLRLQCELDEELMDRIAESNTIYGIERILIAPSRRDLIIEYDATRLNEANLEAELGAKGIPVAQVADA